MSKKVFFLLIYIFSSALHAQEPRLFIGAGTTGTSRMGYDLPNFTVLEEAELKGIEVVTPSYHVNLGYTFLQKPKVLLKAGAEYRRTRFGSRIYKVPRDVHNTTPQYGKTKEAVIQKQIGLFLEATLPQVQILRASSLFFKLGIIRNHKNYFLIDNSYNDDNKKGPIGTWHATRFVPYRRIDLHLTAGLNYKIFKIRKNPIYLQPTVSIFGSPYQTHRGYLHFGKTFKSYLWEFGVTTRYEFARWGKK